MAVGAGRGGPVGPSGTGLDRTGPGRTDGADRRSRLLVTLGTYI